jgi:hypothetical protein
MAAVLKKSLVVVLIAKRLVQPKSSRSRFSRSEDYFFILKLLSVACFGCFSGLGKSLSASLSIVSNIPVAGARGPSAAGLPGCGKVVTGKNLQRLAQTSVSVR